ncbi:mitochondrial dynamin GTPase Msp1 [Coniosporium tulheliwenetii]|uniref:Mitochondrial dynamin GTPase Msp1 n=1 Tax=Coniosporium tulheliwenetii TaxID=3383036 RepID=A0ACC2YKQ9_9PEZI|nr:mitochondrial dynamin GTPase Msp1 [Cladosporium sp. JES 115]
MGESARKLHLLQDLLVAAAAPILAYFLFRQILSRFDPDAPQKEEARSKADAASRKLEGILASKESIEDDDSEDDDRWRRPRKEDLVLTPYEQTIAMEVVAPDEIPVSFEALAHESGACFINLHISTLTEKWYGDSNKLVAAVFSLARKLQPAIVFIDEIDAVLGTRRSGEHEASGMVKAEFMTHWDGLSSANRAGTPQRICILGATNRIQDIDEAILRRLPKKFAVGLPAARARRHLFNLILKNTKIDKERFDLDYLVRVSAGMSGSDIKEACRDAAMGPVRELIRNKKARGEAMRAVDAKEVRGLRTEDFFGRKGGVRQMREPDDVPADVKELDGEGSSGERSSGEESSASEEEFVESSAR